MQRFFTTFPAGLIGLALLILRNVVLMTLVFDLASLWNTASMRGILVAAMILAIPLCVGLFTPITAAWCVLIELTLLAYGTSGIAWERLVMSALNGIVLGVLGPGSYSIDGFLFGRRLIIPAKTDNDFMDL